MSASPAGQQRQPVAPNSAFAILGMLALACGVAAIVGIVILPGLWVLVHLSSVADLAFPHVLEQAWVAGLVAVVTGWYFAVCAYLAGGLKWPWKFGSRIVLLLVLATMSGCVMMMAST